MKNSGTPFLKTGGLSDLLGLTALWCLAIIVVNPVAEGEEVFIVDDPFSEFKCYDYHPRAEKSSC
jgi:hypothetical protein